MSEAKSLFKRHMGEFARHHLNWDTMDDTERIKCRAIIYGACILAEAISNEPDVEMKYIEGLHEQGGG